MTPSQLALLAQAPCTSTIVGLLWAGWVVAAAGLAAVLKASSASPTAAVAIRAGSLEGDVKVVRHVCSLSQRAISPPVDGDDRWTRTDYPDMARVMIDVSHSRAEAAMGKPCSNSLWEASARCVTERWRDACHARRAPAPTIRRHQQEATTMSIPTTRDLLETAMDAHGGLDRWDQITAVAQPRRSPARCGSEG